MKITALALAGLLAGCATQHGESIATAQSADVASTAAGLSVGFAEANPLGVVLLPAKLALTTWADKQPCEVGREMEEGINTVTYAAVGNNLGLVLGVHPVAGAVAGALMFLTYRDSSPIECLDVEYESFIDDLTLQGMYKCREEAVRQWPPYKFTGNGEMLSI